jgi:4-hydroxythreonine-4-phosphate dehydrogenase
MSQLPRLLVTMGDVAGIGPEIIARSWHELAVFCQPIVIGDVGWLRRAVQLTKTHVRIVEIENPADVGASAELIPVISAGNQKLSDVVAGQVNAKAGQAAYDFLSKAIDLVQAGAGQGIVTCPLHKEGLRAAGLTYPGHTEILAERTGTTHFGMVLYRTGLGVIHVTLHVALRDVFPGLTPSAVLEKLRLLHGILHRLIGPRPRIGVAGLNPHASDGGMFGDEEERVIAPAIAQGQSEGINASGPWPSDTLFARARCGEFAGVVAMYHDQGHIPMKLMAGRELVNVSVGLPVVRTSVAHGTAYDIAGRGIADPTSLIEAARVAVALIGTSEDG